jgi:hypothetical protein
LNEVENIDRKVNVRNDHLGAYSKPFAAGSTQKCPHHIKTSYYTVKQAVQYITKLSDDRIKIQFGKKYDG